MRTLFLAAAILFVGGCHVGHGEGKGEGEAHARRDFQVGAFDRIELAGSPDVIVTVGGRPSVRAEGDAETIERLEIVAENGELRIGMRPGGGSGWFRHHRGVTVHVTMPSVQAASIAGSGDIRIDRVEGPRFAAQIGGSGDIEIAHLRVAEANFAVRGSGGIRAAGGAERASATVAGNGDLDLEGFEAADATVALVGSGDISLRATRSAAIDLTGSGDVTITGPARCTIRKSGSGDVRCNA
jgi:DUF4097 and DUF4098 domain-containing protein YvlB